MKKKKHTPPVFYRIDALRASRGIIHHSSFITRLIIFHHISSFIAHVPHIDILILAVCRMFVI